MELPEEKMVGEKVEKMIKDWHAQLRSGGVSGDQLSPVPAVEARSNRATFVAFAALVLLSACAVVSVFHYKRELRAEVAAHQRALVDFGDSFMALDKVNQAIAVYEQACRLDSQDAQAFFKLGLALRQANRQKEAARMFSKARLLDPSLTPPEYELPVVPAAEIERGSTFPTLAQATRPGESKASSETADGETRPRPRFAVQVSSFKSRATANALATQLSDQYSRVASVAPSETPEGTWYRVHFLVATRPEADSLAANLRRTQGLEPLIVTIPF
jgi:tetratricopeptide (TPR) repeat protein